MEPPPLYPLAGKNSRNFNIIPRCKTIQERTLFWLFENILTIKVPIAASNQNLFVNKPPNVVLQFLPTTNSGFCRKSRSNFQKSDSNQLLITRQDDDFCVRIIQRGNYLNNSNKISLKTPYKFPPFLESRKSCCITGVRTNFRKTSHREVFTR